MPSPDPLPKGFPELDSWQPGAVRRGGRCCVTLEMWLNFSERELSTEEKWGGFLLFVDEGVAIWDVNVKPLTSP